MEVHHILPLNQGGSDDIDNAAPLCAYCHDNFGDNPVKRKVIIQMRDLWYELCAKSEIPPDVAQFSTRLDDLYEQFRIFQDNQQKQNQTLVDLKNHFASYFHKQAEQISDVSSINALITVAGSTTASLFNPTVSVFTEKNCPNCGSLHQADAIYCSYCGNKL